MSFDVKPVSLDLTSEELAFKIKIKDDQWNDQTYTVRPEDLDSLILKLKQVRILISGLEAAKKANVEALDQMAKSEEATVVRNILIDDLKKQSEEKKEEAPA